MGLELADIFRQYGPAYRQKYADQLLPSHRQAMCAIEHCRTEALGGQVYACPQCGEVQYSYHSCRNRHCPKCQNDKAQKWLEAQQDLLLPVPYFMLTFTLPAALCEVVRSNQSLLYNLLFRVSAAAAQHLAKDPRFVGGQIGLVGILHTWGRNLAYHPHIHYLIPAGGLATNTQTWPACPAGFSAAGEGALQNLPGQVPAGIGESTSFCSDTAKSLATGLGRSLQAGGKWAHGLEIPGPLRLPRCHQQPSPGQVGEQPGDLPLPGDGHGSAQTVYTLSRSVHPSLLTARAAQRLRQGALFRLFCSWLSQTPGCFAPTT